MSGHSKWSQIKFKKALTDQKKAQVFSKLAAMIAVAAREKGGNPETNTALKIAMEKAREANMPAENIERAIKRGTGELAGEALQEVTYEAYGPGGVAILIQAITDNKNRTLGEIRKILAAHGGKLAEAGSVTWAFRPVATEAGMEYAARVPVPVPDPKTREALEQLFLALDEQAEVKEMYSTIQKGF
ncbi:YebC/PmpR family DNA-binding transcriptional regulator [Candidatus Azambacteria bacterium]|nr:YebC/PmpR family DNA-binding transcriptional regulator [Candidatus Azambacteria bacterium]MBI2587875.1 YebC/PmpR family DNA-binding transcriptional regulator [Candidatus Azambacteria bacterium]